METTAKAKQAMMMMISPSSLPRLLRVVYRVKDLDQSVQFYTKCLGMRLLRKYQCSLGNYTAVLVGYGPASTHCVLELRFYSEISNFNVGNGFGHIGINVENIYKSLESLKREGGKVLKDALQVKGASTVCAFIEDPNGYEIELLQRPCFGDPLCQVMLRVVDLQRAINFYNMSFGMQMLRSFELQVSNMKFRLAFLGFGPEDRTTVLELNSIYDVTHYDKGDAFLKLVIGVDDLQKTHESIQLANGLVKKVVKDNLTEELVVSDFDGWRIVCSLCNDNDNKIMH